METASLPEPLLNQLHLSSLQGLFALCPWIPFLYNRGMDESSYCQIYLFFFLYIIHACSCHDWYFNSSLKAQWWFQGAAQDKQSTRGLLKNSMVLKIVLPLVFRVSVTGSSDGCTVDYAPWLVDSQSPKIGRQHPNPARTHAHQGTSGWLKHWHEQTDLVRADGKEGRGCMWLLGLRVLEESHRRYS